MTDTFPFTLPSGREITMRYPDLWELVFDDTIPDPLTGIVEGLITRTQVAHGMATEEQITEAQKKLDELEKDDTGVAFIQLIVERFVVAPRIVSTFPEGRALKDQGIEFLHVAQLGPGDAQAIFYSLFGLGDQLLTLFRGTESTADAVEPVLSSPDDAQSSVEATEHSEEAALDAVHG